MDLVLELLKHSTSMLTDYPSPIFAVFARRVRINRKSLVLRILSNDIHLKNVSNTMRKGSEKRETARDRES